MPKIGDGTGFESMPSGTEGLSHYGGDEANKLKGAVNDAGQGGHPQHGGEGEGSSRMTPLRSSKD